MDTCQIGHTTSSESHLSFCQISSFYLDSFVRYNRYGSDRQSLFLQTGQDSNPRLTDDSRKTYLHSTGTVDFRISYSLYESVSISISSTAITFSSVRTVTAAAESSSAEPALGNGPKLHPYVFCPTVYSSGNGAILIETSLLGTACYVLRYVIVLD